MTPARPAPRRAEPRARSGGDAPSVHSAELLLSTAERLYAERGLDGVSMREIAREAEQKNNSALHYHFGSKEALVNAILRFRMETVDSLRNTFLDECEATGRDDLRSAVEALVRPLAHGLIAPRPNYHYNRFLAAAQMHPDIDLATYGSEEVLRGFRRAYAMLERRLPQLPAPLLRRRYLTAVAMITFSLADFERIKVRKVGQSHGFNMVQAVENLIDMIVGALAAPSSDPVNALMRDAEGAARSARKRN